MEPASLSRLTTLIDSICNAKIHQTIAHILDILCTVCTSFLCLCCDAGIAAVGLAGILPVFLPLSLSSSLSCAKPLLATPFRGLTGHP
eukprot:2128926-Prorocentrum_lima.AAC.1